MPGKDAPKPVAQITEADLARYVELDERRRQLEREARTVAKETRAIEEKAHAYLKAAGRDQAKRGGFRAFIDRVKGRVPWKQAFVMHCGSDAAAQLERALPPSEKLRIVAIDA